ncbi:MAG TPA: hemolysin III family protein [Solirubrobacteraceae bacterium]|nr:hemolysin III family protein [Solirubrobacteraceae bacterium]
MSSPPLPLSKPRLRGVSHQWGFFVSLAAGAALIAAARPGRALLAASVYAAAVSALLGTSTLYHRFDWRPAARRWVRRLDRSMIYVLIAASYTPFALLAMHGSLATAVLIVVWSGAGVGVGLQLIWPDHPKWVAVLVSLALGWVAVVTLGQLPETIGWWAIGALVLSGVLYSAGAVVYARERPNPRPGTFGYHEVFHALVLAAAAIHYAVVAFVVLPLR